MAYSSETLRLSSSHFRRYLSIAGPMGLFCELAKALSLSLRPLGNIFASEALLIVTAILLPYLARRVMSP
jgi:F0F1-type ATP synthase membrane subunit a